MMRCSLFLLFAFVADTRDVVPLIRRASRETDTSKTELRAVAVDQLAGTVKANDLADSEDTATIRKDFEISATGLTRQISHDRSGDGGGGGEGDEVRTDVSAEAERMRRQFDVLDERFQEVGDRYIHAVLNAEIVSKMREVPPARPVGQLSRHYNGIDRSSNIASDDLRGAYASRQLTVDGATSEFLGNSNYDGTLEPYGFYIHAFFEAAAVVHQLRDVRKFYPHAPVYIMSDGGANFSGICQEISHCRFAWRSSAHDCWNPKPFLDRFHEGATWLQSRNATWTIFLEPDVTLHRRAVLPVKADAGGLRDMWNPGLPMQLRSRMQELGRRFSGNANFSIKWDRFGLAGGSIIRTRAAVISFKPDNINWPEMEKLGHESIYSSDIAMLIALASHGFDYYPWEEVHQGTDPSQPQDTAFQHHSSGEGKPFYNAKLSVADAHLVGPPPPGVMPLKLGQCQHCVWVDERECWPKVWGPEAKIECPSDDQSFRTREWSLEDPQPELFRTEATVESPI
eukprot:TRINITY_DN2154_c0_g1_i2.p1 TRINITY_DN2154_c0_g1~~TRINITY_DN2154_c0_g1_i2.p1  ORF type:complete len:512 (+),score=71.20 TRINITY_DN2154_c0_g1_i2:74-1609(+)